MKKADKNWIDGYILAGGKSSRMGTDKGLMWLHGQCMIQHVIRQLRPAVNSVFIVSNNPEYKKFGLKLIGDLIKDKGPVGGIYSALSHTHSTHIFIVSCDMPCINPDAIEYLINHAHQAQIVLPVFNGRLEPLFGIYAKECLTRWKELMDQGQLKLQQMVTHFSLYKLVVDDVEYFNEQTFLNLNTRMEFNKLIKQN